MNKLRCSSCGYTFTQTDKTCPYCGSSNPTYKTKTETIYETFANRKSESNDNYNKSDFSNTSNSDGINMCVLIILLFVFWPAAVIYAVIKTNKKK